MTETIEWVMLVEVQRDQRVRCDYLDCKHSVYRRIHILKYPDGRNQCLGSGCFKKLNNSAGVKVIQAASVAYFGQGKALTHAQRQQLIDNRSVLLEKLLAQGLREQPSIARIESADQGAGLAIKALKQVIERQRAAKPLMREKAVDISQASPVENYHLLRKYQKFNPLINYAAFPRGEKYSRALDMVARTYRQPGRPVDTASVDFQREVQSLIENMVDYKASAQRG